jgi:hypothetical protein
VVAVGRLAVVEVGRLAVVVAVGRLAVDKGVSWCTTFRGRRLRCVGWYGG